MGAAGSPEALRVKANPSTSARSGLVEQLHTGPARNVQFAPVYGEEGAGAFCSVLRVEGFTILLDCGWTEACDPQLIAPLAAVAPQVDLVLLSHAGVAHTGALPYAAAHFGLRAPVYATLPTQHLGQLYLYELLASKQAAGEFGLMTLDDIDSAFDAVTGVRFSQQASFPLPPPAHGAAVAALHSVCVTAHPAGHSLGGAVWHVKVLNQDFVYAVRVALKHDRHLRACAIHTALHRPALLVADASCARRADPPPDQAAQFCAAVVGALRARGGHVVVPVDTASRVLELLLALDRHWEEKRLAYPLVFLSKCGPSVLAKARAQLEFLSDKAQQKFTYGKAGNPFALRHVHATDHIEALHTLPHATSLVVLAPSATLETGLARDLLFRYEWACDAANTIVLPFAGGRPAGGALGALSAYAAAGGGGGGGVRELTLDVEVTWRVPLSEEEAAARREAERAEREAAAAERDAAAAAADGDLAEGSSGDGGDDDGGGLAATRANAASIAQQTAGGGQMRAAAAAAAEHAAPEGAAFAGVLIEGFQAPQGAAAPMFPFPEEAPPQDDFGEAADLLELCGRQNHDDDDGGDGGGGDGGQREALQASLEVMMSDFELTRVVSERRTLPVRAHVIAFDLESIVSESSFLSMAKAVAPRNLALLHDAPADPLRPRLEAAMQGLFTHIHTLAAGVAVTLPATACYVAALAPDLAAAAAAAGSVARPPYRLGWLDGVVTGSDAGGGRPVLGRAAPRLRDDHTPAAVFLGGMMVSDVSQRLKRRKMVLEHEGDAAVVGTDDVVVRAAPGAAPGGGLLIEGGLSAAFYDVRDEVYRQYRLVPSVAER